MGTGGVGLASKNCGRRFIGFETNKDKLLLAMKRIDQEKIMKISKHKIRDVPINEIR